MSTYWRTMWFMRTADCFLLTILLLFAVQLQGNGSKGCSLVARNPRAVLNYTVGDSLKLNCTVEYCQAEQPKVSWCKFHSNSCQELNGAFKTINTTSSNSTEYRMFVLYAFSSINVNDSGTYRCQAIEKNVNTMGNSILVNVFESKRHLDGNRYTVTAETITMKPPNPMNTPLWIFYSIIVVGIVGAVVFLVMITYFCIRNFHEPLESIESSETCRRTECHAMTETNEKPIIYENANECSEGLGSTIPNSLTVNNCNSPGNHKNDAGFSDTATIIYASLNESMLRSKPSIALPDEEDTEYAAINIKN
uniref:B- and T-lymphocyte attenuator-like n=1 Tax=Pristiophorus japonicus TaxID=55135 RepID=UPI00398EF965